MIALPPGFDFPALLVDLFALVLAFVPLGMLFAAYKIARKLMRGA